MDANVSVNNAENENENFVPPLPTTPPPQDVAPAWVDKLMSALQTQNELQAQRISQLETALNNRANIQSFDAVSRFDQTLLKSLTDIPLFTGEDNKTWESFENEFIAKAAQIESLPASQWVRIMHSRLGARALEHAKSTHLTDASGTLLVTNFSAYCAAMRTASFGQSLSKTAKIHALIAVQQSGKYSDPLAFLREKERLLNQIPEADMAGYVRAALTLWGMESALVTAITPNPSSAAPADGLYYSYADVKMQVMAILGTQQLLLQSGQQTKRQQQDRPPPPPKSFQHYPHMPNARAPYKPAPPSVPNPNANRFQPLAASPSGHIDFFQVICVDCGNPGHMTKNYMKCPLHDGSAKKPKTVPSAKK